MSQRFELILLDADGTLFDYDKAEGVSLRAAFSQYGLPYTAEVRSTYRGINAALWRKFESREISKSDLQHERFRQLFAAIACEGPSPIEFNKYYLEGLANNGSLLEGALETCRELAAHCPLAIATNGIAHVQKRRLASSALAPFVSQMAVSEDAGIPKPQAGFFEYALKLCGHTDKSSVLMVGDVLDTDIKGASDFGISTCWYNPGAQPAERSDLRIDFEIRRLEELLRVVGL